MASKVEVRHGSMLMMSHPGQADMTYQKLVVSIMVIAFFLVSSDGDPGDPLNPSHWVNPCPCPYPKSSSRMPGMRE